MAEGMFSKLLAKEGKHRLEIRSAGLAALVGRSADQTAQHLMLEQGVDISAHRARQLDAALLRWADLVLVMETVQRQSIESMAPMARGKVYRLGEWSNLEIPDPYGQPEGAFKDALELISRGVRDWIARLKGW